MSKGIQGIQGVRGIMGIPKIMGVDLPPQWKKRDVEVASGEILQTIASGQDCSILISDGLVYATGGNYVYGVLGRGTLYSNSPYKPRAVFTTTSLSGKTVEKVVARYNGVSAIDSDGLLHSWGEMYGPPSLLPVLFNGGSLSGKTIIDVDRGNLHLIALDSDGNVHCVGYNYNGQLGDGTTTYTMTPQLVDTGASSSLNGKTVVAVSAAQHSCFAIDSDGLIHAWGEGSVGQLGDGTATERHLPVLVDTSGVLNGKKIVQITGGYDSSLCLDSDGIVYGWGRNSDYAIGDGTFTQRNSPVATDITNLSGKTVIAIQTHRYATTFLCGDGSAYACGYGSYGQLGTGLTTNEARPTEMLGSSGNPDPTSSINGKTVVEIACGYYNTIVKCSDGTWHGCGYNQFGAIGDGTQVKRLKMVNLDTSGM